MEEALLVLDILVVGVDLLLVLIGCVNRKEGSCRLEISGSVAPSSLAMSDWYCLRAVSMLVLSLLSSSTYD